MNGKEREKSPVLTNDLEVEREAQSDARGEGLQIDAGLRVLLS